MWTVLLATLVAVPPATAAPQWAPAAVAPIHPGVTVGEGCTANFVFYDAADVYIGYAAHCAQAPADPAQLTNPSASGGCVEVSLPYGTPVAVEGASRPGTLVYSSWIAMHDAGQPWSTLCTVNDFALVRLDPVDHNRVNPTVPFYGGPTGLRQTGMATGEQLLTYGNSNTRGGIEAIKPRQGVLETDQDEGWTHLGMYTISGVPGDSGSAVLDGAGAAAGVLVRLMYVPPGSNAATDMALALGYMRAHTGLTMRLAEGTEPFAGPELGADTVPAPAPKPDPQPEPERPAPPSAPPPSTAPAPAARPATAPSASPAPKSKRCRKGYVRRRVKHSRRTRCVKRVRRHR
jgi:hypothetical protein